MKGIWEFSVLFLELFYKSELGQNEKLKEKINLRDTVYVCGGMCVCLKEDRLRFHRTPSVAGETGANTNNGTN